MTLKNLDLKYPDLTRRIIGCAMAVHSALGNGFQEVVYQRAMAVEMESAGLSFAREHEMPIWYREVQVGTRRVDFFVEEVVVVELKAVSALDDSHLAQSINYLEVFGLEVGLMVNFGSKRFGGLPTRGFEPGNFGPGILGIPEDGVGLGGGSWVGWRCGGVGVWVGVV